MMIEFLRWDSNFFDKFIGKLMITNNQLPHFEVDKYDLLYVYQNEDVQLEIPNFSNSYSGTKLVFQKELKQTKTERSQDIKSFKNVDAQRTKLYNLAFGSGAFSRFNLDKHFKDSEFRSLYKVWVDNSVNFTIADDVFVFFKNKNIIGFVSFKINGLQSKIGLIAVDTNYQGLGIGTKLLDAVEQYVYDKGSKYLLISTQLANAMACKFYIKNGYNIIQKEIVKHYWKYDSIQ